MSQLEFAEDIKCFHCGYNLRGLPIDGLCPECGFSITITLNPPAPDPTEDEPVLLWMALAILGLCVLNLRIGSSTLFDVTLVLSFIACVAGCVLQDVRRRIRGPTLLLFLFIVGSILAIHLLIFLFPLQGKGWS